MQQHYTLTPAGEGPGCYREGEVRHRLFHDGQVPQLNQVRGRALLSSSLTDH